MRWLSAVVVGVILVGHAPDEASAQELRIAIINLAEDQEAGAVAAEMVRERMKKYQDLKPLQEGLLSRSLERALPTEGVEVEVLARARADLARARVELASFRSSRALAEVRQAEAALLTIPPSDAGQALLADLAFFAGRVHLREQNRGLARSSFELALRLVPDYPSPDPGRFNPDIVSTFAEARSRQGQAGAGTLEISATYDGTERPIEMFIDGKSVGTSPLAVSVSAGTHYIAAVSPEYRVVTKRTDVGDGDSVVERFELQTLSEQDVALRLRQLAMDKKLAAGGPGLKTLARSIQLLARADRAIVIRGTAGELEIAEFRASDESGTYFKSIDGGLDNALGFLAPVPTVPLGERINPLPRPVPWYRRSEVIAGGTGGALAAIALTIFFVSAADNARPNRTAIPGGPIE